MVHSSETSKDTSAHDNLIGLICGTSMGKKYANITGSTVIVVQVEVNMPNVESAVLVFKSDLFNILEIAGLMVHFKIVSIDGIMFVYAILTAYGIKLGIVEITDLGS